MIFKCIHYLEVFCYLLLSLLVFYNNYVFSNYFVLLVIISPKSCFFFITLLTTENIHFHFRYQNYNSLNTCLSTQVAVLLGANVTQRIMFYYPNPLAGFGATGGLSGPPGPTRIPSLELPFSPAQPCKIKIHYSHCFECIDYRRFN